MNLLRCRCKVIDPLPARGSVDSSRFDLCWHPAPFVPTLSSTTSESWNGFLCELLSRSDLSETTHESAQDRLFRGHIGVRQPAWLVGAWPIPLVWCDNVRHDARVPV